MAPAQSSTCGSATTLQKVARLKADLYVNGVTCPPKDSDINHRRRSGKIDTIINNFCHLSHFSISNPLPSPHSNRTMNNGERVFKIHNVLPSKLIYLHHGENPFDPENNEENIKLLMGIVNGILSFF